MARVRQTPPNATEVKKRIHALNERIRDAERRYGTDSQIVKSMVDKAAYVMGMKLTSDDSHRFSTSNDVVQNLADEMAKYPGVYSYFKQGVESAKQGGTNYPEAIIKKEFGKKEYGSEYEETMRKYGKRKGLNRLAEKYQDVKYSKEASANAWDGIYEGYGGGTEGARIANLVYNYREKYGGLNDEYQAYKRGDITLEEYVKTVKAEYDSGDLERNLDDAEGGNAIELLNVNPKEIL